MKQFSANDGGSTTDGQTAATSGNHYFASRNFAASFVKDPANIPNTNQEVMDASARKKQTMSG